MALRHRLRVWGPPFLSAAAGLLAERNYRTLPQLTEDTVTDAGPVSIIIPARNEEDRLPRLLQSLHHIDYPDCEVIVVDDGSTDGTVRVAESYGVQVVHIDGPEAGWTGKSHACHIGAMHARGEWLLFTDADTVHASSSLAHTIAHARTEQAGLLSLLTGQQCDTFWERLLLPYAYALYFTCVLHANGPRGAPVANGQYLLFRREAYDSVGGHEAVRGSIVEDVALAAMARARDIKTVLARGEDAVQVRMYDSLSAIWEGFSKNAFRFVTASPALGMLTVAASIAFGGTAPAALRARQWTALLLPAAGLLSWERRFGVPPFYALLYPVAAAAFGAIALNSMGRVVLRAGTVWKGRTY